MGSRILSSLILLSSLKPSRRLLVGLATPPAMALATLAAITIFQAAPSPPNTAPLPGAPDPENPNAAQMPPAGGLLVEVRGAVAHPGLYNVAKGERVSAAIAAAGGFTPDADQSRLPNMAARLKDGQQVNVPSLLTTGRTASSTRSATGTSTSRSSPVSLNLATADQLAAVPGFTPDLAATVIQYRTEYGGFATTRELVDVLNMSESDYLRARKYLTI
jgi:competence protein ComEA